MTTETIQRKALPAEYVKTDTAGHLDALASTYGTDLVGDRVVPGAFAKTLERWRKSGDSLPLLWNHDLGSPTSFIGEIREARETERGLAVSALLDLDTEASRQAHKLLRRGTVKSLSIGYTIPTGGERLADDGVNELTEIDLHEVSVVLRPANPGATVEAVKQASGARQDRNEEPSPAKSAPVELRVATFEVERR